MGESSFFFFFLFFSLSQQLESTIRVNKVCGKVSREVEGVWRGDVWCRGRAGVCCLVCGQVVVVVVVVVVVSRVSQSISSSISPSSQDKPSRSVTGRKDLLEVKVSEVR